METNIEELLSRVAKQFTPEKLIELSKKSYAEDREYPENFSNWYYHILDFGNFAHSKIINNQIFTWEETEEMHKDEVFDNVNWSKLNEILKPTIDKMKPYEVYNIKNGCFSNKFDFETCLATRENLAQQLWKINYQSSLFDTGGYTELVVRELIPSDVNHQITIYNGMPLRTEVRIFYNMDTQKIEYMVDYWDYDYCNGQLHSLNDTILFNAFHNKYTDLDLTNHQKELNKVKQYISDNIDTLKMDNCLNGIWSIDFLYDNNLDKVYLIDMARGFRSAYWDKNKVS